MRFLSCCALIGLLAVASAAPNGKKDDKTKAVRQLDLPVDGPARGQVTAPTLITTPDELAKAVPDEKAVTAVKKAVDFRTEQVLYFAWSGSGQDKLSFAVEEGKKGPEVTFTFTRGLTRDLRPHRKLYALPRGATFKVVGAR